MSEVGGFNGVNRTTGRSGFFGGGAAFGLGKVVRVVGGAVARGYLLAVAVGGEAGGVTILVGLDEDSGGFTNGVVEGEGDCLAEGVSRGHRAGLLRHGLAASATHCKQGKRCYEGSR